MASKHFAGTLLVFGSIISIGPLGCARGVREDTGSVRQDMGRSEVAKKFGKLIEKYGWGNEFKMGEDMLRELSALSTEKKKDFDVTAFRGKRVAFIGVGAPP